MDKLDVRILREFLQGEPLLSIWPARATSKPSLAILSKKLGVAESTVRERCEKLSPFLSGWSLMVNPTLLRARVGVVSVEVSERVSKKAVVEKLRLLDDMVIIVNYSGRLLACLFLYPDGRSPTSKVNLISRISESDRGLYYTDIEFAIPDIELSMTDLRIILSRHADMTKSNRTVAAELGISSRTVKRRLMRLVKAGAVWPIASLNVGALREGVYADLIAVFRDPVSRAKTEAEIRSIVDDYLIFHGHYASLTYFDSILPSVPTARALLDRVTEMPGVAMARIDFIEDRIELYEVWEERLRRMMAHPLPG